MKIPKLFRLEKDLEKKTEQLVEEAKIFEEPEDINPDEVYDLIADFYDGTDLSKPKRKSTFKKDIQKVIDPYKKFCWGGNNAD